MKIYAHRGGAGSGPENTLLAIRRVAALDIDGIEVDVRAARGGDLVVIHDTRVDRTTGAKGSVSKYTYGEMQDFDAGEGERIPSLRAVVALARDNNLDVILDLKSVDDVAMAHGAVTSVREEDCLNATLFSSFSPTMLAHVRNVEPQARLGIIISFRSRHFVAGALDDYAVVSVRSSAALLNPFIFFRARRAGCEVLAWFGRFEPRWLMRRMKVLGADGLIVSDVARAREITVH